MEALQVSIQGFLFSLSLCLDLGMVNVAIMRTGMERGFRHSFMIGFGSCFGDLLYLLLALIGVSVIFEIIVIKWLLWLVGSVFLLYLAIKMLRDTWKPRPLQAGQAGIVHKSLIKEGVAGFGLAIASPSVITWFALVAGPIVAGMNLSYKGALLYFVAGFFAAGLGWSLAVASASSLSGRLFQKSMMRVLSFLSALLFLYFAIKVFWQGLSDVAGWR
ncbi:LysE family translocator [Paenibacillus agricola]|uniref:LysE family transporter n=1 Tax=Paenibacillus agricola TaxID=2716264 RepID=A0ABX0JC72_9BACL|nr:LysE family transporter [Paenibacillus agricola]NHN32353.1 LysE family transporter [Paenibacillus agricola]